MTTTPETCEHDFHWYAAAPNETGWKCCACGHQPGEPAGFDPHLDVAEIGRKVFGLLHDLHAAKLIYVSNSSMGDGIESDVARQCREAGRYDQTFILSRLLASDGSDYWKNLADAIRAGADPRERCWCGSLATSFCGDKRRCSAHWDVDDPQQSLPGVPL